MRKSIPLLRAILLFSCGGLFGARASADVIYAVFDDAGTNTYGTLDTTTGAFTAIANQTPNLFGMGFAPNGTFYGADNASPNAGVYQIDPSTGNLTLLGASTNSVGGSTVGGDGLIYAVSQDTNSFFYTIDPTTLATNIISSLGFLSDGLAVFANGLFYTDAFGSSDTLEAVDPVTGIATAVGTGMGVQIYSGVNVNGTIYGAGIDGNLYTIDLTTGLASLDVAITGATGDVDALAFTATPEPSTFLLGGVALAGLLAIRRFKAAC